ncbi:aminoglycoside phosphotransferase family protein [Actinospica durhamensis]|uniref:Aminoglycoside phosphotransferase family protein n=1 Tax=Actinospica durhamensis TaxID=1508375 RepID=A0A941EXC5_9ACTN|nr:aminoglycoside phosphotransferase family protein [Actinospica durhamensis]MBR7839048.1 aminoglycoside phosphotransferase family protein [Actinospica durhamensis]
MLEYLITCVAEDFGLELTRLEPIDGGVDRAARNFRGHAEDAPYAVKWSSGGSVAGLAVPDALATRGATGVAAPVRTLEGRLYSERPDHLSERSEREGLRLSVTPWVGERRGIEGGLDAEQWRGLGQLLAATHELPVKSELMSVLPIANHRADVHEAEKTDALMRAAEHTAARDEIAAEARRLWFEHADRIAAATARVRELAPSVTPTTVCHTDPHLGNVLAAPGRVWLIDWDDAALSTPEQDLMFVLGGAYGDEHVGDQERAWFFEGYGEVSIDPVALAYWRGCRGLVDVAFLAAEAFAPKTAEASPGWRASAVRMLADHFAPTGLLARAMA